MFINFSNHLSKNWDEVQRTAALEHGQIIDVLFPSVDPAGDEAYIARLADESVRRIKSASKEIDAVMVQGEYNLTYEVVKRLRDDGIRVVSACTKRDVKESIDEFGNIIKQSKFSFVRFRDYDAVESVLVKQ